MADPTKYERDYSFSNFQANQPNKPLPGPEVDVELDNIADAIGGVVDAVKDVRRSDGALKNGIVTADSLAPTLRDDLVNGAISDAEAAAAAAQQSALEASTDAQRAEDAADRIDLGAFDADVAATAAARNAAEAARDGAELAQTGAETARDDAELAEIGAQAAQTAAEVARDAAFINADVYGDITAGLSATTEGEQFQVVTSGKIIRYRNDGGSATEVASIANVFEAADVVRPDVALAEVDSNGKVLNVIQNDGRHVHNHKDGTIKTSELEDADKLANAPQSIQHFRDDFPFVITDNNNRRLLGVDQTGRLYGPDAKALASQDFSRRLSAPDFATGRQVRRRTVTVATAETYDREYGGIGYPADAVPGLFQRLPDLAAKSFSLVNPLAEALEFRRASADVDGTNYRGGWNPGSGAVPVPGDPYRAKVGWWWHVTADSGNFSTGDRVVMIGAVASSTGFAAAPQGFVMPDGTFTQDSPNGILFRVVEAGSGLFFRGEWEPASAAYPAPENLAAGDFFVVSASGSYSGVSYAYGDHLVRTASGWAKQAQEPITEVAASGAGTFSCPSGSLRDWEVRKKTNSAPVAYFDLRCERLEMVTARVHDVNGNRNIWLHFQDGSVDKLTDANAGNSYAPSFDGQLLTFKSDRSGAEITYQMSMERIPGKFGAARTVHPARSNFVVTVGDSYGDRWGFPFLYQITHDDAINGRAFDRRGATLDGGSLDEHYISSIVTALGEGATDVDYLSGIVCYILDWNNGREDERAAIMRAFAAVRGLTPRFLVTGNTAGRDIRWNGSAMQVYSSFLGNSQKVEDEARLEEMMGGEFFDGGTYANMRKWTISHRNPRFTASDWDPVLQMTVGDVASTYGFWGLWTLVDIADPNYPAMRSNINEANFQGYIDNQSEIVSSNDWHYYVGTGVGDADEGRTYYKLGGTTYSIGGGDGVHLPSAMAAYGYTDAQMTVTGPNSDTSNMMNLMAYDVVTELSARGWLD